MQNDLKALEQRWGLALQSASFGVWDLDPVAQRVHYSPEWKATLGYAVSDAADATAVWRERVHPDDLAGMKEALEAHLAGRSDAYVREFRLRAADGSYRWVLSRGRVVLRSPEGQALRMVGTLSDVTDRHEMESLRAERDRADAANLAKTEFVSRMSHELRTPLNAVLGFAQLLQRQLAPGAGADAIAAQRRYVGHIEQAGWHLLAMINDVLDLSRVESGQLAMNFETVALGASWQAAQAMLAPLAAERGVLVLPAQLPADASVRADPVRLKQVLSNLLSNAIKYNRPGGSVQLSAEPAVGPEGQAMWQLQLRDTGLGIAAAQMGHLFEPFNRLGRQAGGAGALDGVGIGLVLTRWLVQRMGGNIRLDSVEGQGTTVWLSLPAAPAALP